MLSVDFTKIIAWQKSHEYVLAVYRVTRVFPDFEKFALCSQYTRAAVSITANIAEGVQKLSKADKLRFLNISQGSLCECYYYNILSHDLHYIDDKTFDELNSAINLASYFLHKYIEGIENNNGIKDKF